MKRIGVAGTTLVVLAVAEVALAVADQPLLSNRRGIVGAAVIAAWLGLGAHLAYERLGDSIGDAAARAFGS